MNCVRIGFRQFSQTMSSRAERMKNILQASLESTYLDLINESYMHSVPKDAETHFKVVVVSPLFEGVTLIKRHRKVQELVAEEFSSGLHALSIVAKTPDEWIKANPQLEVTTPFHRSEEFVADRDPLHVEHLGQRIVLNIIMAKRNMQETTEWQCKHWGKRIRHDAHRAEVVEIIMNMQAFAVRKARKPRISVCLMETMRLGVHNHDWLLVSKCIEGLAEEVKKRGSSNYWIIWNGGFLALVNVFKDDITKIIDFARVARPMLKCYPRRLGVEIATWMTQKGHFLRGMELINELQVNTPGLVTYESEAQRSNPKRFQIELIYNLVTAAYSYSCWKRDMNEFCATEILPSGEVASVRRVGRTALEQFEFVLEWAEKADADVTIFIQPLIELTIQFRTEFEARKLFLRLVEKYDRNFILEALYLQFIEKHFPFLEEEIEYFQQCRKRYKFIKKDHQLEIFKFRNWRDNFLRSERATPFESKSLPDYQL